MNFHVVADEDTVTGFRYAGVPGVIVRNAREAGAELDRLAEEQAELIIVTTERVADMVRDKINAIRIAETLPLIVEIPGPEGPDEARPPLLKMIREAVGVKF